MKIAKILIAGMLVVAGAAGAADLEQGYYGIREFPTPGSSGEVVSAPFGMYEFPNPDPFEGQVVSQPFESGEFPNPSPELVIKKGIVVDTDVCVMVELENGRTISLVGQKTSGLMEGMNIRFVGVLYKGQFAECNTTPVVKVLYLEIKID